MFGTYRWIAGYSGDANNNPVADVCNAANENVEVTKANPTIATVASPGIVLGVGVLTDTAIVSGLANPLAGATIDFRLYGPDDATCSGTPIFESLGVPYTTTGGTVTSAAFNPTVAGTYRWIAGYSGDANNNPIAGVCNAVNENVVVTATRFECPRTPRNREFDTTGDVRYRTAVDPGWSSPRRARQPPRCPAGQPDRRPDPGKLSRSSSVAAFGGSACCGVRRGSG